MKHAGGETGRQGRRSAPLLADRLAPKGRVEVFVTKGVPELRLGRRLGTSPGGAPVYESVDLDFSCCQLKDVIDVMNIIVNQGKDQAIKCLATGVQNPVLRMAIGDRGTIPSDSTVPKTPLATQVALNNEIFRSDLDGVVLNVGTPTVHAVQFVKTFSAVSIPLTAFSNQATPVVNEVGLITATAGGGSVPFPRDDLVAPAAAVADEKLFATRTFKSVPFEAANDISVTIRYTIFQE